MDARTRASFEQLLGRMAERRALVVGDLMLDHYIWGDAHRISPEAPVPVVHVHRESYTAGGAANVALNVAALGLEVSLWGTLGEDQQAERLRAILDQAGVETRGCLATGELTTVVKTRVMARTQQLCRIDREGCRSAYALDRNLLWINELIAAVAKHDAVIVSDYAKGTITQTLLEAVLAAAAKEEVMVAIDPKPARKLLYRGAKLLTPNRHEALELAHLPEPAHGEPYPLTEVARRIHAEHAPELLVITLGADGMAVCHDGRVVDQLPTVAREVFDVSGAGDTVIAALTAALAAGASTIDAATLANAAAGVVVSKLGTAAVTPLELLAALDG